MVVMDEVNVNEVVAVRFGHANCSRAMQSRQATDYRPIRQHWRCEFQTRGPVRRFCCEFNAQEGQKFAMDRQPAIKRWCATIDRLKFYVAVMSAVVTSA